MHQPIIQKTIPEVSEIIFKHQISTIFIVLMSFQKVVDFWPLLLSSTSFVTIRCVSFLSDMLSSRSSILTKENFAIFMNYIFFPPTLFYGPIILYHDFVKSVSCAGRRAKDSLQNRINIFTNHQQISLFAAKRDHFQFLRIVKSLSLKLRKKEKNCVVQQFQNVRTWLSGSLFEMAFRGSFVALFLFRI